MNNLKYNFDVPLDSPERTLQHRKIILEKKFLKKLYLEWYGYFTDEIKNLPDGKIIELGSGGGFFKDICPEVITSDILPLGTNDMIFSALDMPFDNNSVSGIFMVDTFHHIPDSAKFLEEANRVLMQNGKIVMVEPANSVWGRFIYKNFHHEPFNPKGSWEIPQDGPLSGANGALPWIVFKRDRDNFNRKFPNLEIQVFKPLNPFLYLISGGVSYRQLMPDISYNFFSKLDILLPKISEQLSMFYFININKSKL